MMNSRRIGWVVVASVAFLVMPGSARASFVVDLGSASTSAGLTTFTYNLSFNPNDFSTPGSSQLTSGNYVTLYDFSTALVPGSTVSVPSGISSSIQLLGFTSPIFPGTVPADSASIENITFIYTGSTILTATSFQVSVTLPGTYTLGSVFGNYGGIATYQTTSLVSTTGQYFTPVLVPASVPEPSSLALCGIAGVVCLGIARLRLKRSA